MGPALQKILALLLVVLLAAPALAKLPSHPESVTPLFSGEDAICTAWSINEVKGYWATAAHCTRYWADIDGAWILMPLQNLTIGEKPAIAKKVSLELDLAVLQSETHARAIKLGKYPEVGAEVTVYGYPGGVQTPLATWLRVSNQYLEWEGKWMVLDGHVWPGHSGSPVLDHKGRAVSLVQAHGQGRYSGMTFTSPWSVLRAFIADFVEP